MVSFRIVSSTLLDGFTESTLMDEDESIAIQEKHVDDGIVSKREGRFDGMPYGIVVIL
jgi:hypothetical protein